MTYSLTRFGIYETAKNYLGNQGPPPFYQKVLLAATGGEPGSGALGPGSLRMDKPLTQLFFGRRFHWWVCGNSSGHGERQVSSVCTTRAFGPCMTAFGVVASAGVLLTSLLARLPSGPGALCPELCALARVVLPFGDSTQLCVTFRGSGTEGNFLGPLKMGNTIPLPCAGVPSAAGGSGVPAAPSSAVLCLPGCRTT